MDSNLIESQVRDVIASGQTHQIEHALKLIQYMSFTDDATCALLDELEQELKDALDPPSDEELLKRLLQQVADFDTTMKVIGLP